MSFPIRNAADQVTRIGGFARDISARRQADQRQRLLIDELNHRVKNTLATVLAISHYSARSASEVHGGAGFDRFLADFQARLMALARGHDLLTARTWRGAALGDVVTAALRPWQEESAAEPRIDVSGPMVMLTPKQALGLALGLHELATNAAKHGALSEPRGQVELSWRIGAQGFIELNWQESGGPAVVPPRHRGFGSRLLERGLPVELGPGASVEMNYGPEGVSARIRFRPSQEEEMA
jgi:two-component sensor histidine kinase